VIGGRNKYLINGHVAQPNRVQNLFHSVQLNVNNPHFLIMQGRITKVLNMKPHEILSMLEEAAGTRMYEVKKDVRPEDAGQEADEAGRDQQDPGRRDPACAGEAPQGARRLPAVAPGHRGDRQAQALLHSLRSTCRP